MLDIFLYSTLFNILHVREENSVDLGQLKVPPTHQWPGDRGHSNFFFLI